MATSDETSGLPPDDDRTNDPTGEPRREIPPRRIVVRPATPLAMRVNRNVLIVAAVLMAMTVVTALVLLNPQGAKNGNAQSREETVTPAPGGPSTPSFLEQPPIRAATPGDSGNGELGAQDTLHAAPAPAGRMPRSDSIRMGATVAGPGPSHPAVNPYAQTYADVYATPPLVDQPPLTTSVSVQGSGQSPREAAFAKALMSRAAVRVGGRESASEVPWNAVVGTSTGLVPAVALDSLRSLTTDDGGAVSSVTAPFGGVGTATRSTVHGPPRAESPRQPYQTFLTGTHATASPEHAAPTAVIALRSPYVVQAGSVIPGLLVTGINSDLPGQILAQVSRDVYDSPTEQTLLIPRGSKLLATYDNELLAGQRRVLVAFTRIIFPDGRSVTLPGLSGADRQGEAGLSDQVDNHTRHTFGAAVLLSLISAATQLSQPRTGSSIYAPASPGQVAAGAVGQELANVASQIMRRNLDVAPTLMIRPGTPCNVFLASDLVFTGPYVDERAAR